MTRNRRPVRGQIPLPGTEESFGEWVRARATILTDSGSDRSAPDIARTITTHPPRPPRRFWQVIYYMATYKVVKEHLRATTDGAAPRGSTGGRSYKGVDQMSLFEVLGVLRVHLGNSRAEQWAAEHLATAWCGDNPDAGWTVDQLLSRAAAMAADGDVR